MWRGAAKVIQKRTFRPVLFELNTQPCLYFIPMYGARPIFTGWYSRSRTWVRQTLIVAVPLSGCPIVSGQDECNIRFIVNPTHIRHLPGDSKPEMDMLHNMLLKIKCMLTFLTKSPPKSAIHKRCNVINIVLLHNSVVSTRVIQIENQLCINVERKVHLETLN